MAEAGQLLPGFWAALRALANSGDLDADADTVAQAVRLALEARVRGVTHLHAHFATGATTVARAAAALGGLTYSFTAHAKDIFFDYGTPQHLDRKLRDAAFAITVSDYNLQALREAYGLAARGLARLYNGVDLARFQYVEPQSTSARIVAVGRLIDKKGFHVLVEATRLLRERQCPFSCQLIGDGEARESLQARIDAYGLGEHVWLAGPQPQPAVIRAMREATVLAAPCIISPDGNRDGLPTVLLESMALGTPVVSTAVTGIPELVRDGQTGLCVAPGDPQALADALDHLLGDEALRRQLSRAARLAIEADFDIDINARQMRERFFEAVGFKGVDIKAVGGRGGPT